MGKAAIYNPYLDTLGGGERYTLSFAKVLADEGWVVDVEWKDIKIKENGKFTTKDLLDVLVHIAYSHDFTTNGSSTFQELYPDAKAPSGDLMLYHFSKLQSVEKIKGANQPLGSEYQSVQKKKNQMSVAK